MSSAARHLDDYDNPRKVEEMKERNLKDYQRWQHECKELENAIKDVRKCILLNYKSVTIKALEEALNKHSSFVSQQISSWRYYGTCPREVC